MEYLNLGIAILGLCLTSYGLGYVRGKHDSKTEK